MAKPWTSKNIECPWCVKPHAVYDVIEACLVKKAKWSPWRVAKWVETSHDLLRLPHIHQTSRPTTPYT